MTLYASVAWIAFMSWVVYRVMVVFQAKEKSRVQAASLSIFREPERHPRVWEGEEAPEAQVKAWAPGEADALGITDTYLLIDRIDRELSAPHVCTDDCEFEEVRTFSGITVRSIHTHHDPQGES